MPLSFTEAIKDAQTDYIIDLMRHIRQSYVNALHETEYLSVVANSEVEIDPMPSNRELINWYFKLGNRQFHRTKEPRLVSYLLRDMDKELDEVNKQTEKATEQPQRGSHPLIYFMLGVLTSIALYTGLKLFKK